MKNLIITFGLLSLIRVAQAQTISGPFEIVDLTGLIAGEPELSQDAARSSWDKACKDWKKETKDLNKNNELLSLNCNTPNCTFLDSGKSECSSTGSYQLKTAGTRIDNHPVQITPSAVQPELQREITTVQSAPQIIQGPPQILVQEVRAPSLGFYWAPSFWGWHHYHRMWHHGYWHHSY